MPRLFIKNTLYVSIVYFSLICFFQPPSAEAFIFSKPVYHGLVIDADTKQPVKGAVVIVEYRKQPIIGGPAGTWSTTINIKETLTDKNGNFRFPRYTTVIFPLSREYDTWIHIYKPGYFGIYRKNGVFFTQGIGTKGKDPIRRVDDTFEFFEFNYGIVELYRANTWIERKKIRGPSIDEKFDKKAPLLKKILNEEKEWMKNNKGWKNLESKSSIISAAYLNDIEMIRTLISRGVNLDYARSDGYTALMVAVRKGYLEIVKILIANGANIDLKIPSHSTNIYTRGRTPLMEAVMYNQFNIAKFLLEKNADVNATDMVGYTPLIVKEFPMSHANPKMIRLLIQYGADLNMTFGSTQQTCLIAAATTGKVELVKLFIENGADVTKKDSKGRTAKMWAEIRREEYSREPTSEHNKKGIQIFSNIIHLLEKAEKS